MAITIGICDDQLEQVQMLRHNLNSYPRGEKFTIVESTEPEDFLVKLQANKPHLVFLDIDMGEMSGIQLGEEIKTRYQDTVIVYITGHEKYALEAYRVRAFHYLLKPLTREKFNQVLEEALRVIQKDNAMPENTFTVQRKGEIVCLLYSDIFYFEKTGHKIKIHTKNGDISYYDNLINLLAQLDAEAFVQCHQGYIANVDKIRGFREKTLILDTNLQLPVSRSYVDAIKETLERKLFAGKDKL